MYQGPGRVTSPSPSPKIRRGDRKSLCANVFVRSNRKIIFALKLSRRPEPVADARRAPAVQSANGRTISVKTPNAAIEVKGGPVHGFRPYL